MIVIIIIIIITIIIRFVLFYVVLLPCFGFGWMMCLYSFKNHFFEAYLEVPKIVPGKSNFSNQS